MKTVQHQPAKPNLRIYTEMPSGEDAQSEAAKPASINEGEWDVEKVEVFLKCMYAAVTAGLCLVAIVSFTA